MTKIVDLPSLTTLTNSIILPMVDISTSPGITRKITLTQLKTLSVGPQGPTGIAGPTGPTGPTGLGFNIAVVYTSTSALLADTTGGGAEVGEFAIVNTGDVEDADNSKLYVWNGTNFVYVNDLSGAAGITGPEGPQGPTGVNGATGPEGPQGPVGTNVIVSPTAPISPSEGDFWFNSEDGKSYIYYDSYWVDTNPIIPGPTGPTGLTGPVGPQGPQGPSWTTDQNTELSTTGSPTFANLTVTNTTTFLGTVINGQYQGYDDISLIKDDPVEVSLTLRNLHPDASSAVFLVDNVSGGLHITHQNSTQSSGDLNAGENYIHGEGATDVLNIGLYSDLNLSADSNKFFNPSDPTTSSIQIKAADRSVRINETAYTKNLVPQTTESYDLGSASEKWRSLYVSSSTIYVGDKALSVTASGKITVDGNLASNEFALTTVPVSSSSIGIAGQFAFDNGTGDLYICINTNTWIKSLGTFTDVF